MDPLNDLFAELTPPPGGLDRLRGRLAADRRRRATRWVAGGALMMAALALLWMRPQSAPTWTPTADLPAISVPISARGTVAVHKVSESDAVVFYEVAGTVRAEAPEI